MKGKQAASFNPETFLTQVGNGKTTLSSNSKCNTTGPDGLRCCHAQEMLHTLEC